MKISMEKDQSKANGKIGHASQDSGSFERQEGCFVWFSNVIFFSRQGVFRGRAGSGPGAAQEQCHNGKG